MIGEDVRSAARRNGLELTEAEVAKLAKNADHIEHMAETVRGYATGGVEPASVFHAGQDDVR